MFRGSLCAIMIAALAGVPALGATDAGDEETRVCPGCGEEIPVTEMFCPNCRRYLPDAKPKTRECPECGAAVPVALTFCPQCGNYVAETVDREVEAETVEMTTPAAKKADGRKFGGRFKAGAMVASGMTNPGGWLVLGARMGNEVFVGGGFGYQNYPNGTSVPLFFTARAFMASGPLVPLIYGDVGYNIARLKSSFFGYDDASGILVGFGAGLDILFYKAVGWTLEAGARWETSTEYYRYIYSGGGMSPVSEKTRNDFYLQAASGLAF